MFLYVYGDGHVMYTEWGAKLLLIMLEFKWEICVVIMFDSIMS